MQILDDLYSETKRIFIAGSKFAKGDPRISKYIPILEKMGEKAPVMKKLAEKYALLVEDGRPEALADVGTFLYAVIATQGAANVSGNVVTTTPSIYEMPKTGVPYSRLKPLIDALTVSKQGRYEIVQSGFKDGLLNDFRLYSHLVACLDDKYSELADYIYEKVAPTIGAPLIPYILEQYDPNGKRGDTMRLALLYELGYENVELLAFEAIEKSEPSIAVEGIKIISANPENEEYLLKLAGDKKAAIREAALAGLVHMDSAKGKEMMIKMLQSAKYKNAVQAAKYCNDTVYTKKILDLIKSFYDKLLDKDLEDKEFKEANSKFAELFGALENKTDSDVYDFFAEVLKNEVYRKRRKNSKIHYYKSEDVQSLICDYLLNVPADKAVKIFEDTLTPEIAKDLENMSSNYYRVATEIYSPEQMFDVFSKYYILGQINFNIIFFSNDNQSKISESEKVRSEIDPRWKKLFIYKKDMSAISVLLCEGDEFEQEMKNAILKQAKECVAKKTANRELGRAMGRLVETTERKKSLLFKGELEKAAEICYEIFEKMDGNLAAYFYEGLTKDNFLKLFYPEYFEKFKSLVKQKGFYVFRQIEDALHEAEISQTIPN